MNKRQDQVIIRVYKVNRVRNRMILKTKWNLQLTELDLCPLEIDAV